MAQFSVGSQTAKYFSASGGERRLLCNAGGGELYYSRSQSVSSSSKEGELTAGEAHEMSFGLWVISASQTGVEVFRTESVGAGSGDVTGPESSVDTDLAIFSGSSGRKVKDSGLLLNAVVSSSGAPENDVPIADGKGGYVWGAAGTSQTIFPIYQPETYGAKGDGTTDDTVAIQEAITKASNYGTVYFRPDTNYKVSDQGEGFCLDISTISGITLQGGSQSLLNPSAEGGGTCIFTTSTSTKIIKAEAASLNHAGPKLQNLRIESRSASATGMSIKWFNHYVLERVTFRGAGKAGSATSTGLLIDGTSNDASYGQISGCYFQRHLYGLVTKGSVGATVSGDCYFESNVTNSVLIDLQTGVASVSIIGNKFENLEGTSEGIGIRQGVAGTGTDGAVEIVGNNFEGCPNGGILLSEAASSGAPHFTGVQVHANSFTGHTGEEAGITVGKYRQQDALVGNRFSNLKAEKLIVDEGTDTLIFGTKTTGTGLTGEFLRLGGVYIGSGEGAPPTGGSLPTVCPNGSLYLRKGVGLYVRQEESWVALNGGATLSAKTNSLASDTTMTEAATYYDGPSIKLGVGTWLVQGLVQFEASTNALRTWNAKLWDGTNIYRNAAHKIEGTGQACQTGVPLSAVITLTEEKTVKISGRSSVAADKMNGAAEGGASYLLATKIG